MGGFSGQDYWLALVAAAGTIVSLITLVLTLLWRWSDNQTRVRITSGTGTHPGYVPPDAAPHIYLSATNLSKMPLFPGDAYLEVYDGGQLRPRPEHRRIPGWGADILQPGSPIVYYFMVESVNRFLSEGRNRIPTKVKFVILDGTGKRHERQFKVNDVSAWAEGQQGNELLTPLPWWHKVLRF